MAKFRHTEEAKRRIRETSKERWQDPEYREKSIQGMKDSITDEERKKRSEALKARWQDPAFREEMAKKHKAFYTPEEREKQSKRMKEAHIKDPTISIRQSEGLKRAMASEEYRKKRSELSQAIWDDAHRQNQSRISKALWDSYTPEQRCERVAKVARCTSGTSIELKVRSQLEVLGIEYKTQVPILGGRYFLDIVLPQQNIAIECNGDYWHSLPDRKERDTRLKEDIKETPYTLYFLWESDIKKKDFNILDYIDLTESEVRYG